MPSRKPFSAVTTERRTWMQWVGSAAVLSLADALLGCGSDSEEPWAAGSGGRGTAGLGGAGGGSAGSGGAGEGGSGAWGAGGSAPVCEDAPPFAPGGGQGGVFDGWHVRTVDPQELAALLASWRLTVDGMVEQPAVLRFDELYCLGVQEQLTDFHCVEGWSVYDVPWTGVHLSKLFERVRPESGATHVAFHSVEGVYVESLPLDVALEPRTILGLGIAGSTLPLDHGFPLRVVVPRLLGYKNPKFVERIELVDHPVTGYWSKFGYPYDGEVPESRLRPGKY